MNGEATVHLLLFCPQNTLQTTHVVVCGVGCCTRHKLRWVKGQETSLLVKQAVYSKHCALYSCNNLVSCEVCCYIRQDFSVAMPTKLWAIYSGVARFLALEKQWPPLTEITNFKKVTIIYRNSFYFSRWFKKPWVQKIKFFTFQISIFPLISPPLGLCCTARQHNCGPLLVTPMVISVIVRSIRTQWQVEATHFCLWE